MSRWLDAISVFCLAWALQKSPGKILKIKKITRGQQEVVRKGAGMTLPRKISGGIAVSKSRKERCMKRDINEVGRQKTTEKY